MYNKYLTHLGKNWIGLAAVSALLIVGAQARTWTSADGAKTFEGDLNSYDVETGSLKVTLGNGKQMNFNQKILSEADITYLKENGKKEEAAPAKSGSSSSKVGDLPDALPKPDGKEADMSKPVQVYILLGQSNMLGFGKTSSLQGVAAEKYPYLVDDAGAWTVRKDVRNVRVMNDRQFNNEWMTIGGNIGPEIGIGHYVGHVTDAPVMILKSCIGNRSLGWDLLPPGSEPYEHGGKTQPGYRGTPGNPKGNGEKVAGEWYAGKQYDDDIDAAKRVLKDLDSYYPGAKEYEVAGFFWWQGDKDMRNPAHFEQYEKNLIQLLKALRKDFDCPDALLVTASLGQTEKGSKNGAGQILDAMEAVSKSSDPELKGKVGFVYSHPLSKGSSSSAHYGGNPETYMNIGEAMGKAMVELLQGK
jgi:hypothetical protein